ncbi:hypothetical protein [Spirochaeta cellobiosiphila]|uniref:hypothetical protein n=1 Tax=Spirochaeta cellobiosiphila TaxID=504483 RepID=UPI0004031B28|nr:hypothetical protein [Spirochaeta cellobiosiphila]
MSNTHRFEQQLKQLKKRLFQENLTNITDEVGVIFKDSLKRYPEDFVKEIYLHFRPSLLIAEGEANWDKYFDLTAKLMDVIDLLNEEYSPESSLLEDSFWQFLGAIINDFAEDLDLDTLQFIMKILVDKKAF